MLQYRALWTSVQHASRPRHKGISTRRLLGRAGVLVEAAEVVVATHRRHRHRHRRRHRHCRRHRHRRRHRRPQTAQCQS